MSVASEHEPTERDKASENYETMLRTMREAALRFIQETPDLGAEDTSELIITAALYMAYRSVRPFELGPEKFVEIIADCARDVAEDIEATEREASLERPSVLHG